MDMTKIYKRTHLSPLHVAAFLVVYTTSILLFLTFRYYVFLAVAFIFTAYVPYCGYLVWKSSEQVKYFYLRDGQTVRPGEKVPAIFTVQNCGGYDALRMTVRFRSVNSFYRTFDKLQLFLSTAPISTDGLRMPLPMDEVGRITITCTDCYVTDRTGIFSVHMSCLPDLRLYVLPPYAVDENGKTPAEFTTQKKSARRRDDKPVAFGLKRPDPGKAIVLRSYRTGSGPHDIYWKISENQQESAKKALLPLSGSKYDLLLELPSDKDAANRILKEGFLLIKALLDAQKTIRLLFWNNRISSFETYVCTCLEELDTAYCAIFDTDLATRVCDRPQEYMKSRFPQLKNYLHIVQKDESVRLEILTND